MGASCLVVCFSVPYLFVSYILFLNLCFGTFVSAEMTTADTTPSPKHLKYYGVHPAGSERFVIA